MIIDLEVLPREFLGPPDLLKAPFFHIYELMEVIMINKDKQLIFVAF